MIRKLLATTALASMAMGSAFAAETPAANQAAGDRFVVDVADAALASQLIGETVYASEAENAETIGEVNDLLVGNDGDIDAALIGVGGFLGVGEKTVAVGFDDLKLVTDADGDRYVVLETTREELEAAPAFDTAAMQAAPAADVAVAPTEPAPRTAPSGDMTAAAPDTAAPVPADRPETATNVPTRDTLKSVDIGTISSDDVIGATIYSADDENVGEVAEVVMTGDGKIDAVVLDVGGFLGIGVKSVAVAFADLDFRADENGNVYVYSTFTREQLEAAAEYNKDSYDTNRDAMLLRSGA